MEQVLNSMSMDGVVVIGEGEKDEVSLLLIRLQTLALLDLKILQTRAWSNS